VPFGPPPAGGDESSPLLLRPVGCLFLKEQGPYFFFFFGWSGEGSKLFSLLRVSKGTFRLSSRPRVIRGRPPFSSFRYGYTQKFLLRSLFTRVFSGRLSCFFMISRVIVIRDAARCEAVQKEGFSPMLVPTYAAPAGARVSLRRCSLPFVGTSPRRFTLLQRTGPLLLRPPAPFENPFLPFIVFHCNFLDPPNGRVRSIPLPFTPPPSPLVPPPISLFPALPIRPASPIFPNRILIECILRYRTRRRAAPFLSQPHRVSPNVNGSLAEGCPFLNIVPRLEDGFYLIAPGKRADRIGLRGLPEFRPFFFPVPPSPSSKGPLVIDAVLPYLF